MFDNEVDNGVARVRGVEGEFCCFSTFRPQHTASVVGRVREAVARLTVIRRKTACIQCSILSLGRRCSASCDAVNDRAKSQSSVTCDMEARVSKIAPRMHLFSGTRRQVQHVALTVTDDGGGCKHKRESHFDPLGDHFSPHSARGGLPRDLNFSRISIGVVVYEVQFLCCWFDLVRTLICSREPLPRPTPP
jgi:hypothetical protein